MEDLTKQQAAVAKWGVLGIGGLLLIIAIFTDPVGSSPDSGILALGPTGTRWLLGCLGGAMLVGGAWTYVREKFFNSH